jgi:hypothetical protein
MGLSSTGSRPCAALARAPVGARGLLQRHAPNSFLLVFVALAVPKSGCVAEKAPISPCEGTALVDRIWAVSPSLTLFQKHFARLNLKAQTESQRRLGCL